MLQLRMQRQEAWITVGWWPRVLCSSCTVFQDFLPLEAWKLEDQGRRYNENLLPALEGRTRSPGEPRLLPPCSGHTQASAAHRHLGWGSASSWKQQAPLPPALFYSA